MPDTNGPVPSVGKLLEAVDRRTPLLLLPVRLETRFFQRGSTTELRIRIYPDAVHVDAHEPGLTPDELTWGRHFWRELWKASTDEQRQTDAWSQLVARLGPERAAWVARSLTPTNPEAAPERPVPATSTLPQPPDHPKVPERTDAWTRAAQAGLLPDRWIAWGWRDGRLLFGLPTRAVRRDLALGPDPARLGERLQDGTPVDEGLRWMVDFDEALRAGMALRVPATGELRLDRLVVFGVRDTSPEEGAAALGSHLESLRYGVGLDVLPQGTPTNNTDSQRAHESADPSGRAAMLRELGPPSTGLPLDNAKVLSAALWQDEAFFARLPNGRGTDPLEAQAMNELLFASTWGWYLAELLGDRVVDATVIGWAREHWVNMVRARGPLPALRIGEQPYGLLPVLVGEVRDPRPGDHPSALEMILRRLRATWDDSAPEVTRLVPGSADGDRELVQALATQPHPVRFSVRGAVDRSALFALAQQTAPNWKGWQFRLEGSTQLLDSILGSFGLGGRAQLLDVVYTSGSREWVQPTVTAAPLDAHERLAGDYLSWIAAATPLELAKEQHDHERNTLLYVLARRSALLELTPRKWARPKRFRRAAKALSLLPTERLDLLLREALGACGYRLDAWETSLATLQAVAHRRSVLADEGAEGGLLVGGFGWVEDLVARESLTPASRRPTSDPDNLGFVHAPTPAHGVTAAVLRNAWVSHGSRPDAPLAIDLSSARAQDAKRLAAGVRRGLPIGELLGYRFERALHEGHPGVELDATIHALRELAPLVVGKRPDAADPSAAAGVQAAPAVVDGLALLGLARAGNAGLSTVLSSLSQAERSAVLAELQALEHALDALADAGLAEGLHHLLQGNLERSAAAMEALGTGESALPELEFNDPPRRGDTLTHLLGVVLSQTPSDVPVWPGSRTTPRARFAPRLDDWLATLLSKASTISATAVYRFAGQQVERELNLHMLGLAAIDLVALATDNALAGELGRRLEVAALANRPSGVPAEAAVRVDADRPAAGAVALSDALLLAGSLRRLIGQARPLQATDLALPTDEVGDGVDVGELLQRSHDLAGELRAAASVLDSTHTDIDLLRAALVGLADLGVDQAYPVAATGKGASVLASLQRQTATVAARVERLLEKAGHDDDVAKAVSGATSRAGRALLERRIQAVLGRGLPVLPDVELADPSSLSDNLDESLQRVGDATAVDAWLQQARRVRPMASAFAEALELAELLQDRSHLQLDVIQLPGVSGEAWAALPSGGPRPRGARRSCVLQRAGPAAFDIPVRGLVFDSWSEVVPRARQTTSVAFHYDAPASKAPQSMLLLTLIDEEPAWTQRLVREALVDTLGAIRRRLADAAALKDGGHFLPAVALPTMPGSMSSTLGRGVVKDSDAVATPGKVDPDTVLIGGGTP